MTYAALARLGASCRPIEDWPGPFTPDRTRSPFSAPLAPTLDLLTRELRLLRAERIVVGLAIPPGKIRLDGLPYADAKASHPGVLLAFDSRHGPLRYAADRFRRPMDGQEGWQDNLRAIALTLENLRAVDRYGATADGQQYRGYAALGAGTPMPATHLTTDEAVTLIADLAGVSPVVGDPDSIQRAYRMAARKAHPDTGGDAGTFARLQAARDLLTR